MPTPLPGGVGGGLIHGERVSTTLMPRIGTINLRATPLTPSLLCAFSVWSAADLGSSNVSTPKTQVLCRISPALKPAAPEDGRTALMNPPLTPPKRGTDRARTNAGSPPWEGSGVGRFVESPLSFFRMHWEHEPMLDRVGQPSRLSARASRPRRIRGRDAPAAGGTPGPTAFRFMEKEKTP